MDMAKIKQVGTILVCIALLFIILGVVQNIWLKSQFAKNTNYYLNQAYVDALNLESNKNLLYLIQSRDLEEAEKLLKILIEGQKKVILSRLNDNRHENKAKSRLNDSLKYEPENCIKSKPNKPMK